MTGITLEKPLRTEITAYFHCGPLQKAERKRRRGFSIVLLERKGPNLLGQLREKTEEEPERGLQSPPRTILPRLIYNHNA